MHNLIFWFDNPPRVSKGVFNEVSERWKGKTYYICMNDTREERKKINWDEGGYGKAEIIILSKVNNSTEFINEFIRNHKSDIHIFNGYRSKSSIYLNKLIKQEKNAKVIIWGERPSTYKVTTWYKRVCLHSCHKYYANKYRNKASALLPIGTQAILEYKRYGWREEQMFPFMYIPPSYNIQTRKEKVGCGNTVKFVYLGRFSAATKGVDILIEAFDKVKSNNWTLEMVGGYGESKEMVERWASGKENVICEHSWPINEAAFRLSEYDICIVPSRYDGWNVTVNEAINAGIGTIVTDCAGSDDLIRISKAGKVVRANSVNHLEKIINHILENPKVIEEWKENAKEYAEKISPQQGAEYFIDILEYLYEKSNTEKPQAPWLVSGKSK